MTLAVDAGSASPSTNDWNNYCNSATCTTRTCN